MRQTHFMLYKIYWRLKDCKIHCFWLHCILKYWINKKKLIIQSNTKIWEKQICCVLIVLGQRYFMDKIS